MKLVKERALNFNGSVPNGTCLIDKLLKTIKNTGSMISRLRQNK